MSTNSYLSIISKSKDVWMVYIPYIVQCSYVEACICTVHRTVTMVTYIVLATYMNAKI